MGEIVSPMGTQVLVPIVPNDVVDVLVRKTSRQSKPPRRVPMKGYLVHESHEVLILDKEEPTTYKAAMTSFDSEKWLGAMKFEMESMYDNQV